jgi:hypothetical protein
MNGKDMWHNQKFQACQNESIKYVKNTRLTCVSRRSGGFEIAPKKRAMKFKIPVKKSVTILNRHGDRLSVTLPSAPMYTIARFLSLLLL